MKKSEKKYHVMRDMDIGTHIYMPYLSEDHANRLSALLNEIETARVEGLGYDRKSGVGDFFSVTPAKPRKNKK